MIRTTPVVLIQLLEGIKIEIINDSVDYADRIVRRNIFINSLRKKNCLVGNVGRKCNFAITKTYA